MITTVEIKGAKLVFDLSMMTKSARDKWVASIKKYPSKLTLA